MRKQAIVIGLGQFGMALAESLSLKGMEVIAVDNNEDHVNLAKEFATRAMHFDATDSDALTRISPERRDVCVCAIGDDFKEGSIICTALLRQLGARRVVARANDALHERILKLVGAHEVVNPEKDFGERFANRLIHEQVVGELPLGKDLYLTEMKVPPAFVGRSLMDLAMPRRFGVTLVAIKRDREDKILLPRPETVLDERDLMLVVASRENIKSLLERF